MFLIKLLSSVFDNISTRETCGLKIYLQDGDFIYFFKFLFLFFFNLSMLHFLFFGLNLQIQFIQNAYQKSIKNTKYL